MLIRYPWYLLRSAVGADDVALTTFDYDSWPAADGFNIPGERVDALPDAHRLLITVFGKAADNATAGYKLYGRRSMNGPIILLASGIATLGAQMVTKHPTTKVGYAGRWADTITVTGGLWATLAPVVLDGGANRIAYLRGVVDGMKDLFCEVDLDAVGSGDYMTEFNAIITGTKE